MPNRAEPAAALIRTATAAVAVTLLLGACSPGGSPQAQGSTREAVVRASGEPEKLTVVDRMSVAGLGEQVSGDDEGVATTLSHPVVPGAGALTERLGEVTARERDDFITADPGAAGFTTSWELTAAGGDVVGVRLIRGEEGSAGSRTGYATHWYDAAAHRAAYATELLSGQDGLERLNEIVAAELDGHDGVDTAALHPILRLYDSIGFNPDGDLVVEFDEGDIADASAGRVFAVVDADRAEPLLSDLGRRARAASVVVTPDFALPESAPPPADTADPTVPGVLSPRDSDVDCSTEEAKCVALTFDDGPGGHTGELLDTLAEQDARATFFVTGGPVRAHPGLLRREYAEGHEVANHTVTHPDLTLTSPKEAATELATVNALIRRETGYTPDLMRPPYGATDDGVAAVAEEHGLAEVIWSVDTNDWRDRDAEVVTERALEAVEPGSIVLMHDIHATTVEAVPPMLRKLEERGYTMVTVGDLLGDTEPGRSYSDGHPAPEGH